MDRCGERWSKIETCGQRCLNQLPLSAHATIAKGKRHHETLAESMHQNFTSPLFGLINESYMIVLHRTDPVDFSSNALRNTCTRVIFT